jgi:predicted HTH domain antitoxin
MASLRDPELLEDELNALVRAGAYGSKEAAIGHALEVLLAANPQLRRHTALELYRQGKVTLSRAAEIASLELETFKEWLAEQAVPIPLEEEAEEVHTGVEQLRRLRQAS